MNDGSRIAIWGALSCLDTFTHSEDCLMNWHGMGAVFESVCKRLKAF